MTNSEIIKLAPTLSVEERYKIIIPDCLQAMAGGKSMLSDSEVNALTTFEKNKVWAEYATHVGMFKWAHILWIRDIEKEKFCVCTAILLLNEQLWKVVAQEDESPTKEDREKELETLRKYVSLLGTKIVDFYAYREALPRLREELYGVPIFTKENEATVQGFFDFVDDMVRRHNTTIRELCTNKNLKSHFKLIAKDIDQYLVKELKPDEAAITGLIDEIKSFAESDVRIRLGK